MIAVAISWAGFLLAGAPPLAPCPLCGKPMPSYRLKEGGCKPCVRARVQAAIDLLRP